MELKNQKKKRSMCCLQAKTDRPVVLNKIVALIDGYK